MSKRRRLVALLGVLAALAVICLGLSACGSDSSSSSSPTESESESESSSSETGGESEGESHTLALFGLAAENSFTQSVYKAVQSKAEEMNASVQFFDGKFEGPLQVSQMQDAITSGKFDGFLVMPNDPAAAVAPAEQAIAKGIKTVALEFPIGTNPTDPKPQIEGLTATLIEDDITGAEVTAEAVNEMCKGIDPCKVGMLWGSRAAPWEAVKKQPFEEGIEPNVEVVAEADAGFLQGPGEKATAAFIQSNPDMNVLATLGGDQMMIGGQRALEAAGKEIGIGDRPEGDVALIGFGASKDGVEAVENEEWYSTYVNVPETMGEKATELLIKELNGETLKENERSYFQTDLSPIGDNFNLKVHEEFPEFKAQWEG
jgi:ribose transport system substrate-binding protein